MFAMIQDQVREELRELRQKIQNLRDIADATRLATNND